MRRADAPPPGWYPDPTGGPSLRWWDGLDWTDHRRAPPTPGLLDAADQDAVERSAAAAGRSAAVAGRSAVAAASSSGGPAPGRGAARARSAPSSPLDRDTTTEIMTEVRKVARSEVDRAVQTFSRQAQDATNRLEPLISQYGDRLLRLLRNVGIAAVAVVVLWFVLQSAFQASLLDWLGERVDAILGSGTAAVLVPRPSSTPVGALLRVSRGLTGRGDVRRPAPRRRPRGRPARPRRSR